MTEEEISKIKPEHKRFAEEYIFDFNATRSYKIAYPSEKKNEETTRAAASRLLTHVNVKDYIDHLQADLGKTAGISRLRVLREYESIAFSSIAHLHNTWIERKAFEQLTDEQKACIAEIQTQTKTVNGNEQSLEIDFVKIKLYDKQKALESINKMLGYNEPDKVDLTSKVDKLSGLSTDELIKRAKAVGEIGQNKD